MKTILLSIAWVGGNYLLVAGTSVFLVVMVYHHSQREYARTNTKGREEATRRLVTIGCLAIFNAGMAHVLSWLVSLYS